MKFATVMQIGLYRGRTVEILIFFLKSQKSRYLLNGLTDIYEIWHDYAKWVF